MSTPQKFYLTTPIYYVNARPHIGHAYSTIVADVIARRHRLLGDDVFFLTGTDEHGQKIERSAAAAGIPPQQFADQISETFRSLWKRMGITNDDFIRTTEPRHKQGVQKLFQVLRDKGFIYLDTYTGQYCVSDEAFVEVGPGEPCPECGRITETISESNYYFKLSAFQQPLIDKIESNELLIQPDSRRNEVLSFIRGNVPSTPALPPASAPAVILSEQSESKDPLILFEAPMPSDQGTIAYSALGTPYVPGALKDLSISRTSFKWGIPVPGDTVSGNEDHVIYVWLDALINYMTAVGYGSEAPEDVIKFDKYWPADLHLVGKEIIRFHSVYWPAFLMAADLPLPKSIVANGWLLFEESKMSKSRGNVVRTETILDAFGTLCPPSPPILNLTSSAAGRGSAVPLGKHPSLTETTSFVLLKGTASAVPQTIPTPNTALAAEVQSSFATPQPPTKAQQDLFAADILRYFLLREIPFGQDGSFSFDALVTTYNADLANGYGNLVSRTLTLIAKRDGQISAGEIATSDPHFYAETTSTISRLTSLSEKFEADLRALLLTSALTKAKVMVTLIDGYITQYAPWKLIGSDDPQVQEKASTVLYSAAESIRIITALLYPILPYATAQVWQQLGLGSIETAAANGDLKDLKWGGLQPGTKLGPLSPIFPRADKGLIQTMIDTEERNAQEAAAAKSSTSLIDEKSPTAAEDHPSHDPAAAPRTASLPGDNPGAHVAASAALTTERPGTPPHTEAPASAPFANAAAASTPPDTPQIAIDDFVKIDLRVAKIIVAERIPKADKLLRLEVDLGYEKRQILSGIAEWYQPEDLIGRNIVVIANLAPRKMRGLESHGMLLAASDGENGKPILATFGEEIALGSRLR